MHAHNKSLDKYHNSINFNKNLEIELNHDFQHNDERILTRKNDYKTPKYYR